MTVDLLGSNGDRADLLTSMIINNTPPDVACKILNIDVDDPLYAELIERASLKAFSDNCMILTKVAEGYRKTLKTEIDSERGFTTKMEERFFPPDIKALQLLVDLRNGYSPGRVQAERTDIEQLVIQFVDDLDIVDGEIVEEVLSNEDFL